MKDSYEDEEEEIEGPKSSFSTYLAEGDALYKQGEHKKALDSYTLALEIQPSDKTCLVARSKCYLKLGDPHLALKDAEAALEEDKEYNKGLYQKAEALYSMGDFEYSLIFYHRGHKLRPELDEFRLGIQKAQEAIDNSIGNAARVKLENKGDLSFFAKQDELGKKTRGYSKPASLSKPKMGTNRNKETKAPAPSNKTVKQLLGELYADKEYLEKLMKDSDFINNDANRKIHDLVQDGLSYLDTRTEFWRQQKPLYARKKMKQKSGTGQKRDKTRNNLAETIIKKLEEIDSALSEGEAQKSLKLAQSTMKDVESANQSSLSNKDEIIANLHSCIGNALLDLKKPTKALKHHNKDLEISTKKNIKDGKSRALDNIGRSHARIGNFEKAIESWKEKLPLVKTPLESTWLQHEIGRCHLELGNFSDARQFGEQSFEAAMEAEDAVWQLNASVLIAQADVKLGDLKEALTSFDKSMDLAKSLDDEAAQNAISKAVEDLKVKIDQGEDGNSEEREIGDTQKSDKEEEVQEKAEDSAENDNETENETEVQGESEERNKDDNAEHEVEAAEAVSDANEVDVKESEEVNEKEANDNNDSDDARKLEDDATA